MNVKSKNLTRTMIKNCFAKLPKEKRTVNELLKCVKEVVILDEQDIEFVYDYYKELVSVNN